MQTSLPSLAALSFAARKRVVDRNPLESTRSSEDDDSSRAARSRTEDDDERGPSRREKGDSRAEAAARDDDTVPQKIPPYMSPGVLDAVLSRVLTNSDAFARFQRHLFPRYQNTPRYFWSYYHLILKQSSATRLRQRFPPNEVVTVGSVEELFPWLETMAISMTTPDITLTMVTDRDVVSTGSTLLWFFAASPRGGIRVLCHDPTAIWTTSRTDSNQRQLTASEIVEYMSERQAWTSGGYGQGCGSSNCFALWGELGQPRRRTRSTAGAPWAPEDFANALIEKFASPVSPTVTSAALRSPKVAVPASSDDVFNELYDALVEGLLTLHMAQKGITPEVYCICPVFAREEDGYTLSSATWKNPTSGGLAYITESGWTDVNKYLDTYLSSMSAADRASLGSAIAASVLDASRASMILTDIKTLNMVVRESGTRFYDVRMIDFGGKYTVNINSKPQLEQTSSECLFFINGLLLLNFMAARLDPDSTHVKPNSAKRKDVFRPLAINVAKAWYDMKQGGRLTAFCALLAKDKVYAGSNLREPDGRIRMTKMILYETTTYTFWEQVRKTFYRMLHHYGWRVDKNGDTTQTMHRLVIPKPGQSTEELDAYVQVVLDDVLHVWGAYDLLASMFERDRA